MVLFSKKSTSFIAKTMVFVMLLMVVMPLISLFDTDTVSYATEQEQTVSNEVYNSNYYLATRAIEFSKTRYEDGLIVADGKYANFGAYESYVLTEAGVSVSEWVYGDSNLKTDVIKLMDETISEEVTASSKRVAHEYLTAKTWGETDRADQLLEILKARQQSSDNGSIDNNPYSDMPAFEALGIAGDIDEINTTKTIEYILSQQLETGEFAYDFQATAQAIRSLVYLKEYAGSKTDEVEVAINKGLVWLKSKQLVNGSFENYVSEDATVNTAEVIFTLDLLDINASDWSYGADGLTPIDYMRTKALNDDGSFGEERNLIAATWALDVYARSGVYKAIQYSEKKYLNGTPVDYGWYNFGSYEAYVLTEAGVSVSEWVYSDSNLKSDVIKLMDETIEIGNSKSDEKYLVPAKRVTQEYLTAKTWGETDRAEQLLSIIISRQQIDDEGYFDNNIYSDMPTFDLLGRAGAIDEIDTATAIKFILENQDSETGAWTPAYNDFMTTAQAVRALTYLKEYTDNEGEVETAINKGLEWLNSKQQTDGSFANGGDDPVVDTAEVILTLDLLEIDVEEWKSSASSKTATDYMRSRALSSSGSFGNYEGIYSATYALEAYLKLDSLDYIDTNDDEADDDSTPVINDPTIKVNVCIIGKDGETLYGPSKTKVYKDSEYGYTALGALDATGVDYAFSSEWDNFVVEIEGQKNRGKSGWMYAVNGSAPSFLANKKRVKSNDKVLWWYSEDVDAGIPDWPSTTSSFTSSGDNTAGEEEQEKTKKTIEGYSDDLSEVDDTSIILNADKRMTQKKAEKLQKELDANNVSVSLKVKTEEAVVTDTESEVALLVPEKALSETTTITIKELDKKKNPKQFAVKVGSSTYEFGPAGTKFKKPVTISIQLPITEDIDVESLTPAWYDEENNKWVPVSGIIDVKEGLVVFEIDHFTKFAVIEQPVRKTFPDVDENIDWAKEAIEILAGQGIINGTSKGYEPMRSVTRAEFVKLIVTALDLPTEGAEENYSDVSSDDWFAEVVGIATENKIIIGNGDGYFRPNDEISRNQIATILLRLQKDTDIEGYQLGIKDKNTIPNWALNGVKFANKTEIMKGYEDGTFKGEQALSRAEASVVLYRYLEQYID